MPRLNHKKNLIQTTIKRTRDWLSCILKKENFINIFFSVLLFLRDIQNDKN